MKRLNPLLLFILTLLSTSLLFAGQLTASEGTVSLMLGSFIAGLLLTFTPCVLPMVPILSSIIVGQGENVSIRKSVMLSISYVLGTAVTYALMGILAGATGEQLQSYFQNVWAISAMSIIFVLMALSMFGVFTIQLPSFIQSRLNKESGDIKGGSMPMVFILGVISALILGACVSPVLISFLSIAITEGNPVLGGLMMFTLALGMGVPLILLGFGAGKLLPKAGMWMDNIKNLFGVLLLGVAVYLFESLSLVSALLLWGVYLIGISIFIGALDTIETGNKWQKLIKTIGIIILIWGTLLLVGAANGGQDLTKPLAKTSIGYVETSSNAVDTKPKNIFTNISTLKQLDLALLQATLDEKTVIMYFMHDLCPVCKKLKETTWKDTEVKDVLAQNFVALQINMSDKTDKEINTIKQKYNIFGPPGFIFIDKEGDLLEDNGFYGYQAPEDMLDILDLLSES